MRTPPTFVTITNTYTGQFRKQGWFILQQYSMVRLHIKSHISKKKAWFSQNHAFRKNHARAHFSLTRQNPALLRSAYSQQTYVSFFPITSRLESSGHKCTPSLSAFTAGNKHLDQGNLQCHSSSSLSFGHLSSPTKNPTHSS